MPNRSPKIPKNIPADITLESLGYLAQDRMMDEMKDVNWQSDIREAVEELVREKKRQKLLAESRELRKGTKNIGVSASELIREDRDAR